MKYATSLSFTPTVLAALVAMPVAANEARDLALNYAPWIKTCLNDTCFIRSEGHSLPDCGSIISATLIERLGETKKTLSVTLSLTMNVERAFRVIIDHSEPIELAYTGCQVNGCTSQIEAGAELLAKLKQGQSLTVAAVNKADSPISLAIPLAGFADAYEGAGHELQAFVSTTKKLRSDIEERKARCETQQSQ